jgi:hypothetical protein
MSCFIYGYLEYLKEKDPVHVVQLVEELGVGLIIDSNTRLINFPSQHLPSNVGFKLVFTVGTEPGTNDSTFLTWNGDLDPSTCGLLPSKRRDRIQLIADVLKLLVNYFEAEKIAVAITDSCQIEKVTICRFSTLNKKITADFEISSPPDVLYVATRDLQLV